MSEEVGSIRVGFDCPRCGRRNRAPITAIGKQAVCPGCGLTMRVPRPGQADADAETGEGLRLPPRVGHARYLEALEQMAASKPANPPPPPRRITPLSWVLILFNVIVLGVIVGLVVAWAIRGG